MKGLASKLVGAIIVLAVLFALAPFGTVPAGHRGVRGHEEPSHAREPCW